MATSDVPCYGWDADVARRSRYVTLERYPVARREAIQRSGALPLQAAQASGARSGKSGSTVAPAAGSAVAPAAAPRRKEGWPIKSVLKSKRIKFDTPQNQISWAYMKELRLRQHHQAGSARREHGAQGVPRQRQAARRPDGGVRLEDAQVRQGFRHDCLHEERHPSPRGLEVRHRWRNRTTSRCGRRSCDTSRCVMRALLGSRFRRLRRQGSHAFASSARHRALQRRIVPSWRFNSGDQR